MLQQLRDLGAPPDVVQATQQRLVAQAQAAQVQVWPEHWHAVLLFLAMGTQWQWVSGPLVEPQRVGLRMEAAPVVNAGVRGQIDQAHRQPLPELMRQLLVLEQAALDEWRSQRA